MENSIKAYLKNNLTAEKYRHVLGVTSTALKLAKKNKTDADKTLLAALLHDSGKNYKKAKQKYLKILKKRLDKYERSIPALWHNKLGAIVARKEFNIKDREILNAIKKHSYADMNMSKLDKIIYVSDLIEPNRKFKGVEKIRKAAFKDLDKGFIYALKSKITYVFEKNAPVHPGSVNAWNKYVK
jgi:predicted HD superfamily hydrolase involved in NAD metabolism